MPEGASTEKVQLDSTYNFITECFFLTHSALNLGVHVVGERLLRLNQDLHRIETVWQDVVRQGVQNSEPGQRIREQMANSQYRANNSYPLSCYTRIRFKQILNQIICR